MNPPTVLHNGTVIDGTGSDPRRASILIEGERISEVLEMEDERLPENAEVYDVSGMYVTPGLIDAHDHLTNLGMDLTKRIQSSTTLLVLEAVESLRLTLEAGITCVRDGNGADWGLKVGVDRGLVAGPRLIIVGGMLSPTGGHHDREGRSGVSTAIPHLDTIPHGLCDGPSEVRKKVREMVKAGADHIKAAATGGVSNPNGGPLQRQFSREEMMALVDEAHAWGKPVMVHGYGGPGLRDALDAGCDSVEHGAYLCQEPELLEDMASNGTFLVPTISNARKHLKRSEETQGSAAVQIREKAADVLRHVGTTVRMAQELGVPIAMGTDAGMFSHGDNAYELECLVDEGMSTMGAIVASTKVAADCVGLGGNLGTLEAGKYADVLVLGGDPLSDIGVFRDPSSLRLVMKGGEAYKLQGLKSQAGCGASIDRVAGKARL